MGSVSPPIADRRYFGEKYPLLSPAHEDPLFDSRFMKFPKSAEPQYNRLAEKLTGRTLERKKALLQKIDHRRYPVQSLSQVAGGSTLHFEIIILILFVSMAGPKFFRQNAISCIYFDQQQAYKIDINLRQYGSDFLSLTQGSVAKQ